MYLSPKTTWIEIISDELGYEDKQEIHNILKYKFLLKEEMIDALIAMGINEASIAIESGSPYTQKHIIKKHVNLQFKKQLKNLVNRIIIFM